MATEPTLGGRILDAAADCDTAGEYGIIGAEDKLRALCARADAAERLAVATAAYDIPEMLRSPADYARLTDEFNEALAAWRALGEVQP